MASSRPTRPTKRDLSVEELWDTLNSKQNEWQNPAGRSVLGVMKSHDTIVKLMLADYEERVRVWNEANPELAQLYQDARELHNTRVYKTELEEELAETERMMVEYEQRQRAYKSMIEEQQALIEEKERSCAISPHRETFENLPREWVEEWDRV